MPVANDMADLADGNDGRCEPNSLQLGCADPHLRELLLCVQSASAQSDP
jgi:hypothetical protein